MLLAAKSVLVTGGSGGIGSEIVRRLAANGYRVTFTYLRGTSEAESLAHATGAVAIQLDFLAPGWVAPAGKFDVLVCAAGVNLSGSDLVGVTDIEIDNSLAVNFSAPVKLARAYAPGMVERGWGRIVSVNSTWGVAGAKKRLSYCASKHALHAFTVCTAMELADTGVTVNEVCPGPVQTAMLTQMGEKAIEDGRFGDLDDYLVDCAKSVPTGQLVSASSVASAVLYLISEDAKDVIGHSLLVSGGVAI